MIALLVAVAVYCGAERADVKTFSDPLAAKAERVPEDCTVEELVELPAPKWHNHGPRTQAELRLCRVDASITAYKAEDDNDIHVVVMGASGQTMIDEFPHPDCAGRGHKAEFAAARRSLVALLPKKPSAKVVKLAEPIPVTTVCTVFFDKIHGQLGVAKNGVEGHPCKSIVRRKP